MKCKVEKLCGGCQLLKFSRDEQAKKKREMVEAIMERAHLDVKVAPVVMAEDDLFYRNKVIVGFAKDKKPESLFGALRGALASGDQHVGLCHAAQAGERDH